MVTLGDVSMQLLKPAEDLADWKFPLSQILEDYYVLLEEPCDVNFGEAGVVIQNSTNVYGRRVENLYRLLKQATEADEKNSLHKAKSKKSHVDFDDFVMVDMENDVGVKNIDKKEQPQAQKKIKLLSRQFTQLEAGVAQTCVPIKMYDVTGEGIGKKYDFRCNQCVNTNGMLVDELTSYDFTCMLGSPIREERNSFSMFTEPTTPCTATSGYHSDIRFQTDNNSTLLHDDIHDEFEDEHNFSSIENITENNENTTNNCNEFSSFNDDNLNEIITGIDMLREEHIELNTVENGRDSLIGNTRRVTDNEKETKSQDENIEPIEIGEQVERNRPSAHKKSRKNKWKPKITSTRCKSDLSKDVWKPMSMTEGVKKNFTTDTCVLKIPEYVSLVDSRMRKRKRVSEDRKPECLARFMLREKSLAELNNVRVPPKPKFERLQKHELEDFMKNLDKCLNTFETEDVNGNRTCLQEATESYDDVQCETVMDVDTEPLDFLVPSNDQDKRVENNESEIEADITLPLSIYDNDACNATEVSPDSSNNSSNSLSNYETLIEEEMRQIFKGEDRTELSRTVTNWHAFLQPRLSDSESQAEFRIHEYTSNIIDALREYEQENSTFDNIVRGKPPSEVARYFLASLELANTCNVEIKETCDNIEIKLLSDKGDTKQTR